MAANSPIIERSPAGAAGAGSPASGRTTPAGQVRVIKVTRGVADKSLTPVNERSSISVKSPASAASSPTTSPDHDDLTNFRKFLTFDSPEIREIKRIGRRSPLIPQPVYQGYEEKRAEILRKQKEREDKVSSVLQRFVEKKHPDTSDRSLR
jgi:hypothetical protein